MHAEAAYVFKHQLVRDAAYQLMLPGLRAELHAQAVDAYKNTASNVDAFAHEIVEHCRLLRSDLPERHLDIERRMLEVAAEADEQNYRYEAACDLWQRLSKCCDNDEHPRVLARFGRALTQSAQYDKALHVLEQAIENAQQYDDQKSRAAALMSKAVVLGRTYDRPEVQQQTISEALEATEGIDAPTLRVRALRNAYFFGVFDRYSKTEMVHQVKQVARETRRPQHIGDWLMLDARVKLSSNKPRAAVQRARRAMTQFKKSGNKRDMMIVAFTIGLGLAAMGDEDGALAAYFDARDYAHEVGWRDQKATALFNIGRTFLDRNELDDANLYLEQAQRLSELVGDTYMVVFAAIQFGRLELQRQQFNLAIERLTDVLVDAENVGSEKLVLMARLWTALARIAASKNDSSLAEWQRVTRDVTNALGSASALQIRSTVKRCCKYIGIEPPAWCDAEA